MGIDPDRDREDATTPAGQPTLHWLLERAHRGEITAEEFVKLSKQRGELIRDTPLDTQNTEAPP